MLAGGQAQRRLRWAALAVFLGGFLGLCTLFAAVLTVAQRWQERARARWPEVTADVERCDLAIYSHRRKRTSYYVDCSVRYRTGGALIAAHVSSRSTPAPDRVIWQPQPVFQQMQDWVGRHPPGTQMAVHYDPANPQSAALVTTDMPQGGPQTPDNLRLVEVGAASCLILLAIGRLIWPRSTSPGERSS